MLSAVHSSLAGGRETWRRCKMEEAVTRWMRHVSGGRVRRAPHPSSLSSSPPLAPFVLHSASLTPSPPSCASPSRLSRSIPLPLKSFSVFDGLSFGAVVLCVYVSSSSFLPSFLCVWSSGDTSLLLLTLCSAVVSPPASAAVRSLLFLLLRLLQSVRLASHTCAVF